MMMMMTVCTHGSFSAGCPAGGWPVPAVDRKTWHASVMAGSTISSRRTRWVPAACSDGRVRQRWSTLSRDGNLWLCCPCSLSLRYAKTMSEPGF